MKVLSKILVGTAISVALCVTASAQKNDPKGRPPKERPPVVQPQPKPPPDDKKGPKKPNGEAAALWKPEDGPAGIA